MFDFALSETVVPMATRQARYLYEVELKKRELKGVFADHRIWVRLPNGFASADTYDKRGAMLHGVTVYRLDPEYNLKDIVHAKTASWIGDRWTPDGVSSFVVSPDGAVQSGTTTRLGIGLKPADFSELRFNPEEFSLWQLDDYIKSLRHKGLDPGTYLVDRDLKFAMPLACVIMVALGMALSLDPLPRNLSLGRSFGLAILIGFGYWLAFGITSSLGHSSVLPPWFAAWLPNATFALITFSIFLFGEEH